MQPTKYRAQILLEPEQHAALAEIAQNENRSISDLVREIVRQWLDEQDRDAQLARELQALDELNLMRLVIQGSRHYPWYITRKRENDREFIVCGTAARPN